MSTISGPLRGSFALMTVAIVSLAGCASGAQSEPSSSSGVETPAPSEAIDYVTPREMPEGKGSGEADGVFPRTVAHFAGETTIEEAPQRIAIISTGQMDVLLTLDVVPVAATSGDGASVVPEYLAEAFPDERDALEEITDIGTRNEPSVEKIALVAPDLILANLAGMEDDTLYDKLSSIAPTVITQGTGLYWKQDYLLIGDALGKTDEVGNWLDEYHDDAAALGASLTEEPEVSFLRKNGDRTRVFGIASFSGSVAEDIGLPRPSAQSFEDTSLDISNEELKKADGDWLFYGVQGGNAEELTSLPLWSSLGAVEAEQAVEVDDDAFYLNTGPTAARNILSVLQETLG